VERRDTQAALVEIERRGWDSLCDGTGADFYGQVMAEDGLMVIADGTVMDRDTVVDALRSAPPWRSYSIDDIRLVGITEDSAVLVYTGTAVRDDGSPFVPPCRAPTPCGTTNGDSSSTSRRPWREGSVDRLTP
jgi:Domain of unknown function (DUF4440)